MNDNLKVIKTYEEDKIGKGKRGRQGKTEQGGGQEAKRARER